MRISEASITIKADGFNRLVEYPEMPMVDLIAELFRLHGTSIEVVLPDEVKERFRKQARNEWIRTNTNLSERDYCEMYVAMETKCYFAVQRAMQTANEIVQSVIPPQPENQIADQAFKDKFPGTSLEDLENALSIRPNENTERGTTAGG